MSFCGVIRITLCLEQLAQGYGENREGEVLCVMIITPKKAPTTRIAPICIVSRNEMIQGSFSLLQSDRLLIRHRNLLYILGSKSLLGSLQGG